MSPTVQGGRSGSGETGAFFDLDGTLASSNVVSALFDFQRGQLSPGRWLLWAALFAPKLPWYAVLDTASRTRFNERFFRNYRGVRLDRLQTWAHGAVEGFWRPRLFPAALARLRYHQDAGDRLVLVGGGLEPVLEPLVASLGIHLLSAAQPEVSEGRLSGRLLQGAMSGERKAGAVVQAANRLGLDLDRSYAYGDSYDDRWFLGRVGWPAAVNPDQRLRRLARRKGWTVHDWRPGGRESDLQREGAHREGR